MDTYKFKANIEGDICSGESYPIYNDGYTALIGGFTLNKGDQVLGFVSGTGHPAAIFVSTGDNFYFTPREDKNGMISHGIVSEVPISPLSIAINMTNKERFYD